MIRINLLGQARPPKVKRAVPLAATLQVLFLVLSLVFAGGVLFVRYYQMRSDLNDVKKKIETERSKKTRLEQVKRDVERFTQQKAVLQQRIGLIQELERNERAGQELLDIMATTVTRTESLWLTSLGRKGNVLTIDGTAGSHVAVANFITQLKRSGYFDKVEIKESRQDERSTAVTTFLFTLTADFVLPQSKVPAPAAPGKG